MPQPIVFATTVVDYADGDSDQSDVILTMTDGVIVIVHLSMN